MRSTVGNSNLGNLFVDGQSIYGKYMLTNSKAIRASFYTFSENYVDRVNVQDDVALDPDSVVYDSRKYRENSYNTSVGQEFRRGQGRFRGVFGASVIAGIMHWRDDYEYGNAMSASNTIPTISTGFYQNGN